MALLLSPDGGTQRMQLYIGEKGKDSVGGASSSFLARNGLAYGSYYYLNDTLPAIGTPSTDGFFDTTTLGSLVSAKLEDVDTNPNDPTQVVIGIQETGLFTFDFNLDFGGGSFNASTVEFLAHENPESRERHGRTRSATRTTSIGRRPRRSAASVPERFDLRQ